MSDNNLYDSEAKNKLKSLVESIDFAMMATRLSQRPIHTVPMSTKKVDGDGAIWFLSGANSEHNTHIKSDADVQLIYSKPSSMEFLTIYGNAFVTTDRDILEELYGTSDDMWFEGSDDPLLTAIMVEPQEAQYWDSKHNKFITLMKMGMATLTGDQPDIGETGTLNL